MRLSRLTISGFRCYGPTPVSISFEELTAFVGANGAGKTAALLALVRMFGTTKSHRTLVKDDFFRPSDIPAPTQCELLLDAIFEFPELLDDDQASASRAIPECLRAIRIPEASGIPTCRIILKGQWAAGTTAEGEVEQKLCWAESSEPTVPEEKLHPLSAADRALIQVFYVPAARDATRELRAVSGTLLSQALRHAQWSDEIRGQVQDATAFLSTSLREESDLKKLEAELRKRWSTLCDIGSPQFTLPDDDLSGVLRRLDAKLVRDSGQAIAMSLLSEGEQSLMYLALAQSALSYESMVAASTSPRPVLTILAVEEPENHLSPQYLGRILNSLRLVAKESTGQSIVTSHSASLMRRVSADEIRHFQAVGGVHRISSLKLPEDDDTANKYIREAVQAYPELYFAKVVVLCEGASEESVLPRIARAFDLDVDPKFIAVVPLGGRHVSHFWRLLTDLGTPFVTLLDLDLDRNLGGWKRIHDTIVELKQLDATVDVTDEDLNAMGNEPTPPKGIADVELKKAIAWLEEQHRVFFSAPLDLDLLLLRSYEEQYHALAPQNGGPRIGKDAKEKKTRIQAAVTAVLGAEGGDGTSYSTQDRESFPWYSYLFIGGSKPSAHARAMAGLDDSLIQDKTPEVLQRLIACMKQLTNQ